MYEEILKRDREGRQPIRTIVQQEVVSKHRLFFSNQAWRVVARLIGSIIHVSCPMARASTAFLCRRRV